jgi:hypothetical protein
MAVSVVPKVIKGHSAGHTEKSRQMANFPLMLKDNIISVFNPPLEYIHSNRNEPGPLVLLFSHQREDNHVTACTQGRTVPDPQDAKRKACHLKKYTNLVHPNSIPS